MQNYKQKLANNILVAQIHLHNVAKKILKLHEKKFNLVLDGYPKLYLA